jgi:ferrous iron transport protein B
VLELPPLRLPVLSNVITKTVARLEWYLKEVIPLFLAGTALLFTLDKTGALPALISAMKPVVSGWLGLPAAASTAFLVGFLRRDFGATGLFVMQSRGQLSPEQVVVAMVTITLFIPCVASVFMIARERGVRTAVALTVLIFPLAFLVGGALHWTLVAIGWGA